MRLLVVSQYFWPEEFRINELVAELVRRGHQVTVLTGKPNYPGGRLFKEYLRDPDAFATYEGAKIIRVPMLSRGEGGARLLLNYLSFAFGATVEGIHQLAEMEFDATLVFEPSPVTVGLPAIAFRRLRKWPIAFWVLDQWPETLSAIGTIKSKAALSVIGRLVSFIYSRCDLILAPSRSLAERIRSYSGPKVRVEYFPNWSEEMKGSAEPAPELSRRPGVFSVMFAGNIGVAQDFSAILDAAELLKTNSAIRWLIVGDGRMSEWVRAEVARRGLGGTVELLGRHPLERMPSFFTHADALLVSLRSDPIFAMTIPGKVQSYLGAGLPLIGMLDGEGASAIREAGAGMTCASGDSQALARIVVKLAALRPNERAGMGASGAAYAKREFDRGSLVDRLEGWLGELSAGQRA